MNCIKVKRNNLLNSIYSSVSPDVRFKETSFVNFFTDPELSSSLYVSFGQNIVMLYEYITDTMNLNTVIIGHRMISLLNDIAKGIGTFHDK